jgi:hypothetical protein
MGIKIKKFRINVKRTIFLYEFIVDFLHRSRRDRTFFLVKNYSVTSSTQADFYGIIPDIFLDPQTRCWLVSSRSDVPPFLPTVS